MALRKIQAEANAQRIQAEKWRADEIHMAQINAARDQANIQADTELALEELNWSYEPKLKPVAVQRLIQLLKIKMLNPRS